MNTRNPFENTGVSTYVKTGLTMQKAAGDNMFYDIGVRYAHAFNEKFALKARFHT